MLEIDELLDKYEISSLKNFNKENVSLIINFLVLEHVDFIEDLLSDYLDIFLLDYEDFKKRFLMLKKKYGNNLVEMIAYDLNILEEIYTII